MFTRRQRTRPLLLLGGLTLALLGAFAAPAQAQEEGGEGEGGHGGADAVHAVEEMAQENGATEFDAHCVAIIADGGSVDDCQEAPNPLLPETKELVWGGIGFLIVFAILAKFGFPAMKKSMDERTERIRGDLKSAEDQRNEAETVLSEYRAQLQDARSEAGRILDDARQTADQLKRDREAALETELAEMRERAQSDIEASKSQAVTELRGELTELAVGAAETVVRRNLDASTQQQLVEEYIDQVASGSRS